MNVVFWGAKGQAKVVKDALGHLSPNVLACGDRDSTLSTPFRGVPILNSYDELFAYVTSTNPNLSPSEVSYLVTIGGGRGRERVEISGILEGYGFSTISAVHERSIVSADSRLGKGVQILGGASVVSGSEIGDFVIVNTGAVVEHDSSIGLGSHIAPNATVLGEVVVEDYVFVGAGATILPGRVVGRGSTVGAGAVVTRDVDPGSVVRGCPAR